MPKRDGRLADARARPQTWRRAGGGIVIIVKRPSWFLAGGFALLLALTLLCAWTARGLPTLGLAVRAPAAGDPTAAPIVTIPPSSRPVRLLAIAPAADRTRAVRVTVADDAVRQIDGDLSADTLAVQDRLVAAVADGRAALLLRDAGGRERWIERAVTPSRLGGVFWIQIVIGLFGGAVGLWLIALQPNRLAAWGAGLSGIGLLGATFPVGIQLNAEFIVGGAATGALLACNYLATQLFAGGFVVLFARYPRPLLSPRTVVAVAAVLLAAMLVLVVAEPSPARRAVAVNVLVLIDFALLVALLASQWRATGEATGRDPVGRAYLRLVGITWTLSLGVWVAATVGPQLVGRPPMLDVATGFLLMVPPYAAIALGIARGVMFDVDAWAGRLLASAVTLFAILAGEATLILAFGIDRGPATSLAFALTGLGWLAARHRLFDGLFGRRREADLRLLTGAHRIVLAADAEARAAAWRDALDNAYAPFEIGALSPAPARSVVAEQGLALHVAPPRFAAGLVLRSARRGRALFRGQDAELLDQLRLLCDRIDDDRMAYDRGMREERGRIAQDLHDDVSARLLTSLHRDRPDLMRNDVRAALVDIRSMVSGLEGCERALADLLGDLRREAGERLAAAGVALAWYADDAAIDGWMLGYPTYRAINAIVREITTNVIRHAGAGAVAMTWTLDPDAPALALIARDDGVGLGDAPAGSGRRNIAVRAAALGGSARFAAGHPGATGTQVAITLPLAPRKGGVRPEAASARVAVMDGPG